MILMTKLKIAAIFAGMILLPLGAGLYRLGGFSSGATPPLPTTQAEMATPAPIASTQPMDVSQADSGVIPFLNSNTGLLIAFDLDTLDLAAARECLAGIMFARPAATAHARKMADQLTAFAQKLRQSGAKRLYMMLVLRGDAQQNPVVIVPLAPGADSPALRRLFGPTHPAQPFFTMRLFAVPTSTRFAPPPSSHARIWLTPCRPALRRCAFYTCPQILIISTCRPI